MYKSLFLRRSVLEFCGVAKPNQRIIGLNPKILKPKPLPGLQRRRPSPTKRGHCKQNLRAHKGTGTKRPLFALLIEFIVAA